MDILQNLGRKCFHESEFTDDYPQFLLDHCHIYYIRLDGTCGIFKGHEEIIGIAALFKNKDKPHHLMSFFIDPEHHNKGFGFKLLTYVQKFNQCITLHVRISNIHAIKLYQKCNFEIYETISNYYHQTHINEDGYTMLYKRTLDL